MDGFNMSGKAFFVVEELRRFAEQYKGKTVAEVLKEKRRERLEKAIAAQFGMTVEEYRSSLKGKKA